MSAGTRETVRIGLVGGGRVARARHLPAFRALAAAGVPVKVVAICNRRRETAARVAREFEIPKIHGSWEALVDDPNVDAVVVATWPNLHGPVTLAALDAGKHVLTQAPMAMNAREAQRMAERAKESSALVVMLAHGPYGLAGDPSIRTLKADGVLGALREVHVHSITGALADPAAPLGWRQVSRYVGYNILDLGFLYEVVLRWVSPARRVFAQSEARIPTRIDPETGAEESVGAPDAVQVVAVLEDDVAATFRLSAVSWHGRSAGITLVGGEGTIVYDLAADTVLAGRREAELEPVATASASRIAGRVEAEFVATIRGARPMSRSSLYLGVRVMQFAEAVARSARHHVPVGLPLQEFSNPSL